MDGMNGCLGIPSAATCKSTVGGCTSCVVDHGTYSYATESGRLWLGDATWEKPLVIEDGKPVGVVLGHFEQAWLDVCWLCARKFKASRDKRI